MTAKPEVDTSSLTTMTMLFRSNQMKTKKYRTVGTVPQCNRKIVESDKIDTSNPYIHDCLLSWLGTSNTYIHDCLLSWLGTSNTYIQD